MIHILCLLSGVTTKSGYQYEGGENLGNFKVQTCCKMYKFGKNAKCTLS